MAVKKSKWAGGIKPVNTHKVGIPGTQISVGHDAELPKIGRPRTGKRSDPAYRQVSAWVRRDTYEKVTKRLFNQEDKREFSDLVQSLLEQWLTAGVKK